MYDLYTVYSLYITIYDYINIMLKIYYNNYKIRYIILYYYYIICTCTLYIRFKCE